MKNKKILCKISALLNVTQENGATLDEALTAAKKAQELISKYHITILENPHEKETIGKKILQVLASGFRFSQILSVKICPAN